jgi:hypothetical protein
MVNPPVQAVFLLLGSALTAKMIFGVMVLTARLGAFPP